MGGSVNYRKGEEWAKEYDKTLLATDPRFGQAVAVIHSEGTVAFYVSAFVVEKQIDEFRWYIVFAEHHPLRIFDADDVTAVFHFADGYGKAMRNVGPKLLEFFKSIRIKRAPIEKM